MYWAAWTISSLSNAKVKIVYLIKDSGELRRAELVHGKLPFEVQKTLFHLIIHLSPGSWDDSDLDFCILGACSTEYNLGRKPGAEIAGYRECKSVLQGGKIFRLTDRQPQRASSPLARK